MIKASSGKIVLVPSCLNQYNPRARYKTWPKIIEIPVPQAIADKLRISILPASDRIIDDPIQRPKASNADTCARRIIFTTFHQTPTVGRLVILRHLYSEVIRILADNIAYPATPALRQLRRMTGRKDLRLWLLGQ